MNQSWRLGGSVVLIALVMIAARGAAQTTTGSIRGEVRDPTAGPLAGATVTVTGERGVERTTQTGASGRYLFTSLPPGDYSVTAALEGRLPQTLDAVRVTIAGTTTVDIVLIGEQVSEQVTVTAEAPLIDLTSSQVGTNYTAEFIEDLPTRRRFWNMVAVSPGVSSTTEWTAGQSAFGSGVTSNSWNIDGLDVTAPEGGGAWWYINPETIEEVQVLGIGASAEFGNMTGAAINVVTKSGTNEFRGAFNAYLQDDSLTDTNARLEDSEYPTYELDRYHNLTLTFGGPMKHDKAWFFAAGETNRESESEPGVDPAFPARYDWDRYDLKLDFSPGNSTSVNVKLHDEDFEIAESGSPYITPSSRALTSYDDPAWGAGLTHVFSSRTLLEASYAGWWSEAINDSLTGSTEPAFADYSPPGGGPTLYYGGVIFPYEYETSTHQADVKLSHYAEELLGGDHDFRFGIGYSRGAAEALTKPGSGGGFYYHYTYEYEYYGTTYAYEYYYLYTFRPFFYGAEQDRFSAFVNDSWQVNERLTLNAGVRFDQHDGTLPSYEVLDDSATGTGEFLPEVDSVIDWSLISPRLGFAYQATTDGRTVIHGSFGVYYDGNVSGNWNYPPPGIPPIQVFFCDSTYSSCDDLYYETVFPTALNVDPDLDPPRSLQYALGADRQIGKTMRLGAILVYKESDDLIGWEVLDDGVYVPTPYTNPFNGEVYTLLDLCPPDEGCRPATIRKGNRPGAGSLAPDEDYHQDYSAFILTFERRYSDDWSLMGSYTWSQSEGLLPRPQIQTQGSVLYGNLDGSDPNEWLNADQLLQNDREHMLRLQGSYGLPWNLELTGSVNLQSGRPFARLDRARLGQGSTFFIVEEAADDRRLPSTALVDLGIGKRVPLGNQRELKIDLQVLNVLNEDANTFWESLWVGPDESYVPSDFVWPRRLMLRLGFEF
jgi:outer membrane receptor protein involved in Fe transport